MGHLDCEFDDLGGLYCLVDRIDERGRVTGKYATPSENVLDRAALQSAIASAPAPTRPTTTKEAPRRLTAYEIEEKLKATGQALALVKDVRDTADFVHEIKHKALHHFAHRDSAQAHIFDLGRCRNETTSLYDKVRAFCDDTLQYPDLVQSLQPLLGTISNVTVAVEHFRTAYNNLTQAMQFPKDTADSGVFGFQIQPFLGELDGRLNYLEDQRHKTRDAVIAIRQETAK